MQLRRSGNAPAPPRGSTGGLQHLFTDEEERLVHHDAEDLMDGDGTLVPTQGDSLAACGTLDAARAARLFEDWFGALSEATRRGYSQDLTSFAAFIGAADQRDAAVLLCCAAPLDARDMLLRFRTSLRDAGAAPGTINRRISALKSLFRHAVGQPLVVPSMKNVRRRKVHRGNGASIVQALLDAAAEGGGLKALRDRALVLALADSGLRRSEAASLRVCDLDLDARVAHVRAKGSQGERVSVDLSEGAVEALRAYLSARAPLPPEAPAFANAARNGKGSALTDRGIHFLLTSLSRKAGLPHPVAPHDLRRHGARSLAKAGADAETLRSWGRWADYRTPARYVGEATEKAREGVDLLERLRRAGPMAASE